MGARLRLASLLVVLAACAPERPEPLAENLLLITLDTTRADYVSGFGGAQGVTPSIARLADRSAAFVEARSQSNVTNPSHVSIMSGLPMRAHGVTSNRIDLPESVDTLPEAFSRAGFATGGFVAASHLGLRLGWRGFDQLEGPDRRFAAKEVTSRAVRWLRRNRTSPFFLWVHYFDPHMIYEPSLRTIRAFYQGDPMAGEGPPIRETREFLSGFPRKEIGNWLQDVRDPEWPRAMYAAALHEVDAQVQRLLHVLPKQRPTVVILVADHGESLGEHGIFYDHRGLYETQLRIPLLIHVPALSPQRSELEVSTLDIAPTVAELFALDLGNAMSGLSLVSALRGRPDAALRQRHRSVHEHAHRSSIALRDGDWKLLWQRRLVLPFPPGVSLYHLGRDPGELEDLAAREPERAATLLAELEALVADEEAGLPEQDLDAATAEQLRALGYAEP